MGLLFSADMIGPESAWHTLMCLETDIAHQLLSGHLAGSKQAMGNKSYISALAERHRSQRIYTVIARGITQKAPLVMSSVHDKQKVPGEHPHCLPTCFIHNGRNAYFSSFFLLLTRRWKNLSYLVFVKKLTSRWSS